MSSHTFSDALREALEDRRKTVKELADHLGVDVGQVQAWLTEEGTIPDETVVNRISEYLRLPRELFLNPVPQFAAGIPSAILRSAEDFLSYANSRTLLPLERMALWSQGMAMGTYRGMRRVTKEQWHDWHQTIGALTAARAVFRDRELGLPRGRGDTVCECGTVLRQRSSVCPGCGKSL